MKMRAVVWSTNHELSIDVSHVTARRAAAQTVFVCCGVSFELTVKVEFET